MLQFLGRLHPLVVHFPIALVLVAALLQLLRGRRTPSETVVTCLGLGALSAVVAASLGWIYAEQDPLGSSVADTLLWHRWTGIVGAAASSTAAVLAWRARRAERSVSGGFLLVLTLAVLGVGGGAHLGGELVYGEDFLTDPFERPEDEREESDKERPVVPAADDEAEVVASVEESTTDEPEPDVAEPPPSDAPTDDLFTTAVLPIFEANCFECHGATGRAKAGLRLHTEEALFDGDRDLWTVIPGDPEASFLYELITLPADDEDLMPPEGRLSDEDIERVRAWIAALPPRDG